MTTMDYPSSSLMSPAKGRSARRRLAGLAAFALSVGVAGSSFAQSATPGGGGAPSAATAQPASPPAAPQPPSAAPPPAAPPQPGAPAAAPYGQPGGYPPGYGQPGGYPPGYGPYGGYPPAPPPAPGYGAPVYYGPRYYPYPLPPPPPPRPRRSVAAMVSGIILASSGGIVTLAGLALVSEAQDDVPVYCDGVYGVTECGAQDNAAKMRGGVGMLIGGGLALVAGVPLAVWGAARVPADATPDKGAPKAAGHRDQRPDLRPEVRLGATSGSLSWRF